MTTSKKTDNFSPDTAGNKLLRLTSSCMGLGYLPVLPSAFGCLPGILCFILFNQLNNLLHFALIVLAIMFAIVIIEKVSKIDRIKSSEHIVIDSAIGMWISFFMLWESNTSVIITGLILFYFICRIKPFPINIFRTFRGGTGIVADDIAAGMITNLVLRILLIRGFF